MPIRVTEDIDILVDVDLENQRRVKKALEILPDKAILELGNDDLQDYTVVRVSDDILVDVMTAACGIDFEEASGLWKLPTLKAYRFLSRRRSCCCE